MDSDYNYDKLCEKLRVDLSCENCPFNDECSENGHGCVYIDSAEAIEDLLSENEI